MLILLLQCGSIPEKPEAEKPEKKSILLANGEFYSYIEQGRPNSAASSETLLFIHGNMASSLHFLPLFRYLGSVHLIALDLRGFGDSSYKESFSSLAELADDVKLFADALSISSAHVVGWSLGGGVAMELAVLYPELVSTMFLIEAVSYKGMPFFKANAGAFVPYSSKEEMAQFTVAASQLAALKEQDAGFFKLGWDLSIYTRKKPEAAESRLYIAETLKQRSLLDVYWALACFNMSTEHNGYVQGSGSIAGIKCPVALTCADDDLLVSPSKIRENSAAMPGSRLLRYKNCGHSPMVDKPGRLAEDILKHSSLR